MGPEFKLAGINLEDGSFARIVRALYGLPTSGRAWHLHLAETLRGMRFMPTRYDPDVYMRLAEDEKSYDYLGCHTDEITIVAKDPRVY